MPGPGKKPNHLKIVAGTDRPDRTADQVVELPLLEEVPAHPDWLPNAHAIKEWKRLAPILHANKLLTEAGLSPLAHLCALHGKIVQLYAAGEAPSASMSGTLNKLHNDFGLTPVAAGKVQPSGQKDDLNPFAKNGHPPQKGGKKTKRKRTRKKTKP